MLGPQPILQLDGTAKIDNILWDSGGKYILFTRDGHIKIYQLSLFPLKSYQTTQHLSH